MKIRDTSKVLTLFTCLVFLVSMVSGVQAAQKKHIDAGFFGLWGMTDIDEGLSLLQEDGFSLAVLGASQSELDKAAKYGIKAIVSFDLKSDSVNSEIKWNAFLKSVANTVKKFKGHPAVFAWYPVDEPELQGIPVSKIEELNALIKACDPAHPLFTVVNSPGRWKPYLQYFDILAEDRYLNKDKRGVPESPAVVGDHIRRLKNDIKALGLKKSVWAVVGAFDLKHKAPHAVSYFHKPSPQEINAIIEIALEEGVDGVLVYTLAFKNSKVYQDWNLPKGDPELWNAVRKIPKAINKNQEKVSKQR